MRYVLALLFFLCSQSQASIIYDWSGTCTVNCTGVAHAVFTLKDSYVPGTTFHCGGFDCAITNILYTDNTRTTEFIVRGGNDPQGMGRLPVSPFDPGALFFGFAVTTFDVPFWSNYDPFGSDPLGKWIVYGENFVDGHVVSEFTSRGIGGRFTLVSVPEPGSLLLVMVGLVGVKMSRKRVQNTMAKPQ